MFTLLHVALLTCGLGASLLNQSLPYEKNNDNEYQLKYDNHKNVVYNDNDYSFTFTYYEFTNTKFDNLSILVNEDLTPVPSENFYITFNNLDYLGLKQSMMGQTTLIWRYTTSGHNYDWKLDSNNYFIYVPYNSETYEENNIIFYVSNERYSDYKTAIELDTYIPPYSFDDDNYQITISADYLNNVEYRHLFDLFYNHIEYYYQNLSATTMVYDTQTYTYDELLRDVDTYEVFYVLDDDYIYLRGYQFSYYNGSTYLDLEDSVVWHLNQYVYVNVKNALQQDFYYYSLPVYNPFMEIIDIMTSGITTFSTGLGAGVSELVDYVFLTEDNHLSVFASITIVFAGIALAIGLSRYVMNYLISLGAKK